MAERNRLADDAERYERQAAFDFARANVRLEGFVLDAGTEALAARYVAGEISSLSSPDGSKQAAACTADPTLPC